jgi:hypothetical protein
VCCRRPPTPDPRSHFFFLFFVSVWLGHFSADLFLVLLFELEVLKVFRLLSPCVA